MIAHPHPILTASIILQLMSAVARAEPSSDALAAALTAQQRRIELVARIAPAVVCIFDSSQRGGGSGVIIDEQGYGLTNFHVAAALTERRGLGGLSDGKLYELHVLGIDPTGDVAMFQLLGRDSFPHVDLGDSDTMNVGDRVLAMGNPFVLAEDYTPTVTLGIVTGVHRYQWGSGNTLVYSDCIQTDAPINPGNSGGPLFNEKGEVIGINGRISVNTRGRFNVGFGYAISSNQICRFIPALRAGLLARHGTMQATVDEDQDGGVSFNAVMRPGPAWDAGVRVGDRLMSLGGQRVVSRNHVASLAWTYPAGWPLPLTVQREGTNYDLTAYLEAVDPLLEAPFETDSQVNLRETERCLQRYRRAVLKEPDAPIPQHRSWKARRVSTDHSNEGVESVSEFDLSQTGDGPARMIERFADGTSGQLTQYDTLSALRHIAGSPEPITLPPEQTSVLAALYLSQFVLTDPIPLIDLNNVHHAGTDAAYNVVNGRLRERVLEVLEWPLSSYSVARFSFDVESGLLERITVRDIPSGSISRIRLDEYVETGSLRMPSTIQLQSAAMNYTETWYDFSLEP